VHFPPVEKDWKPEMIYAVEITTKSGKGLFWVLVNRTIAPGDTISIESASEKTE
jgi:hypothetical protein